MTIRIGADFDYHLCHNLAFLPTMFPSHPLFRPTAGPSSFVSRHYSSIPPPRPRDISKSYTGPSPSELSSPRSIEQAEKYFRRVAGDPETRLPSTRMKWLGVGGWVAGAVASTYMILYADFGSHEHVFQPVRRHFHALTNSLFQLSDSERSILGMDDPLKKGTATGRVKMAGTGDKMV